MRRRDRLVRRGRPDGPLRRVPHPPRLRPAALTERTGGVLLAALTAIAVGLTYTDQAALIPLLKADLLISDVQAGFLPTALFVSAVITMLATATLADRIGAKRMNLFGVGFSLASNLLFAVAPTYETLLLAKAVGGIGSGMAFVGGVRYIAGLYPGARSHFGQGVYGAGYPLGSALGLQLMPPLALAFGGWRGAFVTSSALLLAVLVVYAWLAPA
ncbi:MAG TPA: MFS transporter, partial [Candidatus Limnocylindria bacterium]